MWQSVFHYNVICFYHLQLGKKFSHKVDRVRELSYPDKTKVHTILYKNRRNFELKCFIVTWPAKDNNIHS